jgi:hypothetical protein
MKATKLEYNPGRHWLKLGWWEINCTRCDFICTVPNLFCLRELLATAARDSEFEVIRRTGMRRGFRARARLRCGRDKDGHLFKRIQHKGG